MSGTLPLAHCTEILCELEVVFYQLLCTKLVVIYPVHDSGYIKLKLIFHL